MFTCTTDDQNSAGAASCLCCQPALRSAERRLTLELSRRGMLSGAAGAIVGLGLVSRAQAAAMPPIVFTNVRVFDGRSPNLRGGVHVLIEDAKIKDVASGSPGAPEGARLIDCGGNVLMPGLIDAHWHALLAGLTMTEMMTSDVDHVIGAAGAQAERTLMRGFTTVRDLGGPVFPLKKAIDAGQTVGPRIYPCGAMITTTGGHGDLRPVSDLPRSFGGPVSDFERKCRCRRRIVRDRQIPRCQERRGRGHRRQR